MEALFVPWGLLFFCCCIICSLLKRWYKLSVTLLVSAVLLNWYGNIFSFGLCTLSSKKEKSAIKVLTWNINYTDSKSSTGCDILVNEIMSQRPDIVFLNEYQKKACPDIDSLLRLEYPYKAVLSKDKTWNELYSRMPISLEQHFENGDNGSLFRVVVECANRPIRLYCLHLQSNNIIDGETFYPDSIANRGGISRYLQNYKVASEIRREQAELIVSDFSDAPTIVMGDMNDVCGSPCMRVFAEAGLKDAWWEGGFGYGATIHRPLPYRIDHVMYGKGLKLKGIKKVSSKGLSDQDALVADFEISNNNSMEWYTWIFSGIGVAILGWIGSFIFRKKNNGSKNAEGDYIRQYPNSKSLL